MKVVLRKGKKRKGGGFRDRKEEEGKGEGRAVTWPSCCR